MTGVNPRKVKAVAPDGKRVNLASLPLVAYSMRCGHVGRDYAVQKRDIVFCQDCGSNQVISRIIAS